jgi:hypothetical protein
MGKLGLKEVFILIMFAGCTPFHIFHHIQIVLEHEIKKYAKSQMLLPSTLFILMIVQAAEREVGRPYLL